jgi:hypothetical protein
LYCENAQTVVSYFPNYVPSYRIEGKLPKFEENRLQHDEQQLFHLVQQADFENIVPLLTIGVNLNLSIITLSVQCCTPLPN